MWKKLKPFILGVAVFSCLDLAIHFNTHPIVATDLLVLGLGFLFFTVWSAANIYLDP